jgi:hypothetical protein
MDPMFLRAAVNDAGARPWDENSSRGLTRPRWAIAMGYLAVGISSWATRHHETPPVESIAGTPAVAPASLPRIG